MSVLGENPARFVCFCFEHTVEDVLAAMREDGSNRIEDEIREACRRGLDQCATKNPRGRCCLGQVRALVRARTEPTDAAGDDPGCCGG